MALLHTRSSSKTATRNHADDAVELANDSAQSNWHKWLLAAKEILPLYLAIHIAALVITGLSVLFTVKDFTWGSMPLYTLWKAWNQWDSGHYYYIATHGYTEAWRTAFFPLYSLLEAGVTLLVRNPFVAGLIISNVAGLVAFVVLYRLVWEDFDEEVARRSMLYLALFPTAFFLMAAYNESLFLCLSLLSFYQMRHGRWWLAGLCGFLACLTRSAGLFLLVPFLYEYLRQHDVVPSLRKAGKGTMLRRGRGGQAVAPRFNVGVPSGFDGGDERERQRLSDGGQAQAVPTGVTTASGAGFPTHVATAPKVRFKGLRFDLVSALLIPAGVGIFALYCYVRFGDVLAFSHAQSHWSRQWEAPWSGMVTALKVIAHSDGLLSFYALRNLTDLLPDLLVLILIMLGFIGPWRFPRTHCSYGIYAAALYLFLQLVPMGGTGFFPLQSMSRFMLEIFPAFIVLARLGKYRMIHLNYLLLAGAMGFFLLTQFLTGHWVM